MHHSGTRLLHKADVTSGVADRELTERLTTIARGTGEVDAVYHIAFGALHEPEGTQERLLPYENLAQTPVLW